MSKLVFLYDKIMNPHYNKRLKLPMRFISFGYIEAKLYNFYEHKNYEYIAIDYNSITRGYGNNKVFGAIYLLKHSELMLRELDSIYACSKGILGQNNRNDIMHRKEVKANIIQFDTLEELGSMKYINIGETEVIAYLGNCNNEYIKHRVGNRENSYREQDGVDKLSFRELFEDK